MPATKNWKDMRGVHKFQPESYEELVAIKGGELSTARGLSLVVELIYGERELERPRQVQLRVRGQGRRALPVDRRAMDEVVDLLKTGIGASELKRDQKFKALQSLRLCVPPIPKDRMDAQVLG
jgi:hypothetical protein